MKNYEEIYRNQKRYWGTAPSDLVKKFAELAPVGHALDLGMGEGRDALYLAKQGFDVTGIEAAPAGVEKCLQLATKHKLPLKAVAGDARLFKIAKNRYGVISAINLFQFFTKDEAHALIESIAAGLKKGGLFLCETFSIDDPHYQAHRKSSIEIAPGVFRSANGQVYSLYAYGELFQMCSSAPLRLRPIHYTEYDYYDTSHGPGHWHGVVDLVAKKL